MSNQKGNYRRNPYSHLYLTHRWRKIRAQQLKDYPLCIMCEEDGLATIATVCDHVERHGGNEDKFYAGPFQSLCKLHHDSTKAKEENRKIIVGSSEDGLPIDKNHHWHTGKF